MVSCPSNSIARYHLIELQPHDSKSPFATAISFGCAMVITNVNDKRQFRPPFPYLNWLPLAGRHTESSSMDPDSLAVLIAIALSLVTDTAVATDDLASPFCANVTLLLSDCMNSNSSSVVGNEASTSSSTAGATLRPATFATSSDLWTSTNKFYLGVSIWLGCIFLGIVFAVKMRQLPMAATESSLHQRSISAHQLSQDKDNSTDPHPSTTLSPNPYYFLSKQSNFRSSTSSQSVVPISMRSLASIASTVTANHLNHHNIYLSSTTSTSSMTSLGDFRPSRPADPHVPRFVYRESDDGSTWLSSAALMTGGGTRRHTEQLQDLNEDTCFESMRTRISNLTMLDMYSNETRHDEEYADEFRDKVAVVV
ncbi:hypothetical protein H310_12726 [Aphanomyces invadans]|uniref:Uncharacterized protein n=1 Tax=Aphanomyces invadans TaxID=157072 RepID=A0A024TGW7_9STRA|nr:hypothetical protein H310_12726 [Aphanomyces invadans]ETV93298.1 hypothetical protein H310_12726 [Aphanomyces invadans]RHY27094.1 hypothetical protein DYB32_007053 [Aphanomyces invadans]|eukprot:XP_008878133.1 hypothetical protein H310_12726 [Aphanomyces invadans]